jgi:hypothetical protein
MGGKAEIRLRREGVHLKQIAPSALFPGQIESGPADERLHQSTKPERSRRYVRRTQLRQPLRNGRLSDGRLTVRLNINLTSTR